MNTRHCACCNRNCENQQLDVQHVRRGPLPAITHPSISISSRVGVNGYKDVLTGVPVIALSRPRNLHVFLPIGQFVGISRLTDGVKVWSDYGARKVHDPMEKT